MGKSKLKKGSRVTIPGSKLTGTIRELGADNLAVVWLDLGARLSIPVSKLEPSNTKEPEEEHRTQDTKDMRGEDGRFLPGHKGLKFGNDIPEQKAKIATARSIRRDLTIGMAPIVQNIPTYIAQIEEPDDKVLAATRVMKYIMPSYTSVTFTETPPRNLSAEQVLLEMKRKFAEDHARKED